MIPLISINPFCQFGKHPDQRQSGQMSIKHISFSIRLWIWIPIQWECPAKRSQFPTSYHKATKPPKPRSRTLAPELSMGPHAKVKGKIDTKCEQGASHLTLDTWKDRA
jgi:hypothetical protein